MLTDKGNGRQKNPSPYGPRLLSVQAAYRFHFPNNDVGFFGNLFPSMVKVTPFLLRFISS